MHIESSIQIAATDGYPLGATLFYADDSPHPERLAIVNCATGVKAVYYARYARFLADHGYLALTWDYRGIGASRPASLRGFKAGKFDWGSKDFEGVLQWAANNFPDSEIHVVGHSIGGVMPGYAASCWRIDRLLAVGAQYAYWRDYAQAVRRRMFLKWHVAMPLLSKLLGYFPGRALGWLEDLPAGVACEWAFRRARLEHPEPARADHFALLGCPTLAYTISDDPFGTPAAVTRLLDYYVNSKRTLVSLTPHDLHLKQIGHFAFFHDRFRGSLWPETLQWLTTGIHRRRILGEWPSARIVNEEAEDLEDAA
ncbi:alpha/beta fold hydrolase [Herbaspirillum rhizosphaerae]|uniref:alpha/beta hydrolase family protein n=1 Tax=Herbaspirillum rhizosphaerae TaxID=346179 RepID=UPI00067E63AF|nr:alpha/beta fold hydrolase [Herbaspirillum rhizosphaerae]